MKTEHEKAVEAIREMNSDTSVSLVDSLDNLRGLRDEIAMLMDSIEADIRKQGKLEEELP